ncbi:AAA family ATPase [Bernardetia sp.]|uniref:AAA family ATPase n=1 Tax=Bernardetia sp. TaxID=1937974 RepID=UPI0025BA7C00|nr:AAA family ATPase [Bernardetia sp.]
MQRIVIKNFGAIKEADIELKKITVLIGEQASGKSTVAKLVYFFKTLKEDFFREIYNENGENNLDSFDMNRLCEEKFYNLFGSTVRLPHFEIYYYFNELKHVRLWTDKNKKLQVFFSPEMKVDEFINTSNEISKRLNDINTSKSIQERIYFKLFEKKEYTNNFFDFLDEMFANRQSDFLYIIAGRNATVSYSELFEKYLFAEAQNKVKENSRLPFVKKRYNIDEVLMLKFIERIVLLKEIFEKNIDFKNELIIHSDKKQDLKTVLKKTSEIIKGKYSIDKHGEKIIYDDKEDDYVLLSNASSGQQEVIRILQDILINIAEKSKVFRIVEEPEAHLFPSAQKQLIELLSFLMNQNEDNQIIITTHSPYVLTVFNNLLFSKRIVDKNIEAESEVSEVVEKEFWIDSNDFSAYDLGKIDDSEKYTKSILSEKTGLIQQNYLDEVSEKLGGDFQKLYSIHQKSFVR